MDYDVRMYTSAGVRKAFNPDWITSVDFELAEQGGFQNGSITVQCAWDDLSLDGTEYVDIRCFDATTVTYRGYVMRPEQTLADPETWTLSLFGMMERANGYLVRKCYCYADYTDVGTIFQAIVTDWVAPNIAGLVVDVTGISALNIKLLEFCATGKTASQAFNQLVESAPLTMIWGFDVTSGGVNQIYLRPRSATVQDTYIVGKDVTALTYPRDVTQVVNKGYFTGGTADLPNLAPNASFENCVSVTSADANLLLNGSFETQTPSSSRQNAAYWNRDNSAVRRQFPDDNPGANLSRTGNCYIEMTNATAIFYQTVQVGYAQPINVSIWARQNTNGDTENFRFRVQELDSVGTVLATQVSGNLTPATSTYEQFSYTFTLTQPTCTQAVFVFEMMSAGGTAHGIIYDDAVVTLSTPQAADWTIGTNSDKTFATLDWASTGWAKDGLQSVEVIPSAAGAGYVELVTRAESNVSVAPGKTHYFSLWAYGVAGTIVLGWREYADGVLTSTQGMSVAEVVVGVTGSRHTFSSTTGTTTNTIQPFIRIYDSSSNPVYVDAVMITVGAAPPLGDFYKGSNYEAVRSVTDYTVGQIGTAQSASIASYGLREKAESVDLITNSTLLDTFVVPYLAAFAVPAVQGKLEIKGAVKNVGLTGTLRVVNLPSAPPALFPSRVRYRIGDSFDISVDLNNQRPDMAQLLRKVANQAVKNAVASGQVSAGGTGGGGGGGSYPSSAGVTSFQSDSNTALTGAVVLVSGIGTALAESGQNITVNNLWSRKFL